MNAGPESDPDSDSDSDSDADSDSDSENVSPRHKKGTLSNLLQCQLGSLKVVNALDFPMPSASHPPTAIASDLAAFHSTVDLPLCGRTIPFPAIDCRWGLAATDGAFHFWHTDANGFGTYIDTQAGYKWWVIARPKDPSTASNISFFMETFRLVGANDNTCILEAILLTPGSRL